MEINQVNRNEVESGYRPVGLKPCSVVVENVDYLLKGQDSILTWELPFWWSMSEDNEESDEFLGFPNQSDSSDIDVKQEQWESDNDDNIFEIINAFSLKNDSNRFEKFVSPETKSSTIKTFESSLSSRLKNGSNFVTFAPTLEELEGFHLYTKPEIEDKQLDSIFPKVSEITSTAGKNTEIQPFVKIFKPSSNTFKSTTEWSKKFNKPDEKLEPEQKILPSTENDQRSVFSSSALDALLDSENGGVSVKHEPPTLLEELALQDTAPQHINKPKVKTFESKLHKRSTLKAIKNRLPSLTKEKDVVPLNFQQIIKTEGGSPLVLQPTLNLSRVRKSLQYQNKKISETKFFPNFNLKPKISTLTGKGKTARAFTSFKVNEKSLLQIITADLAEFSWSVFNPYKEYFGENSTFRANENSDMFSAIKVRSLRKRRRKKFTYREFTFTDSQRPRRISNYFAQAKRRKVELKFVQKMNSEMINNAVVPVQFEEKGVLVPKLEPILLKLKKTVVEGSHVEYENLGSNHNENKMEAMSFDSMDSDSSSSQEFKGFEDFEIKPAIYKPNQQNYENLSDDDIEHETQRHFKVPTEIQALQKSLKSLHPMSASAVRSQFILKRSIQFMRNKKVLGVYKKLSSEFPIEIEQNKSNKNILNVSIVRQKLRWTEKKVGSTTVIYPTIYKTPLNSKFISKTAIRKMAAKSSCARIRVLKKVNGKFISEKNETKFNAKDKEMESPIVAPLNDANLNVVHQVCAKEGIILLQLQDGNDAAKNYSLVKVIAFCNWEKSREEIIKTLIQCDSDLRTAQRGKFICSNVDEFYIEMIRCQTIANINLTIPWVDKSHLPVSAHNPPSFARIIMRDDLKDSSAGTIKVTNKLPLMKSMREILKMDKSHANATSDYNGKFHGLYILSGRHLNHRDSLKMDEVIDVDPGNDIQSCRRKVSKKQRYSYNNKKFELGTIGCLHSNSLSGSSERARINPIRSIDKSDNVYPPLHLRSNEQPVNKRDFCDSSKKANISPFRLTHNNSSSQTKSSDSSGSAIPRPKLNKYGYVHINRRKSEKEIPLAVQIESLQNQIRKNRNQLAKRGRAFEERYGKSNHFLNKILNENKLELNSQLLTNEKFAPVFQLQSGLTKMSGNLGDNSVPLDMQDRPCVTLINNKKFVAVPVTKAKGRNDAGENSNCFMLMGPVGKNGVEDVATSSSFQSIAQQSTQSCNKNKVFDGETSVNRNLNSSKGSTSESQFSKSSLTNVTSTTSTDATSYTINRNGLILNSLVSTQNNKFVPFSTKSTNMLNSNNLKASSTTQGPKVVFSTVATNRNTVSSFHSGPFSNLKNQHLMGSGPVLFSKAKSRYLMPVTTLQSIPTTHNISTTSQTKQRVFRSVTINKPTLIRPKPNLSTGLPLRKKLKLIQEKEQKMNSKNNISVRPGSPSYTKPPTWKVVNVNSEGKKPNHILLQNVIVNPSSDKSEVINTPPDSTFGSHSLTSPSVIPPKDIEMAQPNKLSRTNSNEETCNKGIDFTKPSCFRLQTIPNEETLINKGAKVLKLIPVLSSQSTSSDNKAEVVTMPKTLLMSLGSDPKGNLTVDANNCGSTNNFNPLYVETDELKSQSTQDCMSVPDLGSLETNNSKQEEADKELSNVDSVLSNIDSKMPITIAEKFDKLKNNKSDKPTTPNLLRRVLSVSTNNNSEKKNMKHNVDCIENKLPEVTANLDNLEKQNINSILSTTNVISLTDGLSSQHDPSQLENPISCSYEKPGTICQEMIKNSWKVLRDRVMTSSSEEEERLNDNDPLFPDGDLEIVEEENSFVDVEDSCQFKSDIPQIKIKINKSKKKKPIKFKFFDHYKHLVLKKREERKRREEEKKFHNNLEKLRRWKQRQAFEFLNNALPNPMENFSKVAVIMEATITCTYYAEANHYQESLKKLLLKQNQYLKMIHFNLQDNDTTKSSDDEAGLEDKDLIIKELNEKLSAIQPQIESITLILSLSVHALAEKTKKENAREIFQKASNHLHAENSSVKGIAISNGSAENCDINIETVISPLFNNIESELAPSIEKIDTKETSIQNKCTSPITNPDIYDIISYNPVETADMFDKARELLNSLSNSEFKSDNELLQPSTSGSDALEIKSQTDEVKPCTTKLQGVLNKTDSDKPLDLVRKKSKRKQELYHKIEMDEILVIDD